MNKMITPIETIFKGYKFRSRLEARWAVFFDCLNVKWEYEREGFDLTDLAKDIVSCHDSIGSDDDYDYDDEQVDWLRVKLSEGRLWYLPDFYLSSLNKYVEIKPYIEEGSWQGEPCNVVTKMIGGVLVHGTPGDRSNYEVIPFYDSGYWFGYCPKCKAFGYGFDSWAERICPTYEACGHYRKDSLDENREFHDAVIASRQATFTKGKRIK